MGAASTAEQSFTSTPFGLQLIKIKIPRVQLLTYFASVAL